MEHLEHEWDRQREQLSALLDDELDEQERAALEAHLSTCAACRAELESLRRARALVRALPPPTLPRNFALPLAAAPIQAASAARPAPASTRRPASMPPARITSRRGPVRMLQWFSTIAAVLGLILLCSSALSILQFRGGADSSTVSRGAQVSGNQPAFTASPSAGTTNTQPDRPTPAPTAPKPTATQGNGEPGNDHSPTPVTSPGSSAGPLIPIPVLGALLLILSVVGFTITWWLRRRW